MQAYRDAWKLLLRFAAARAARSIPALRIADLDVDTVLAFLDSLEVERHNAVETRNQRRSAIQAFFRYLPAVAPECLALSQRMLTIPVKRTVRRTVDYLERAEMDALVRRARPSETAVRPGDRYRRWTAGPCRARSPTCPRTADRPVWSASRSADGCGTRYRYGSRSRSLSRRASSEGRRACCGGCHSGCADRGAWR